MRFDKFDAIYSVKMGIQECLYEMHSKKTLKEAIEEEDKGYVERMMHPVKFDTKIVEKYNDTASIHIIPEPIKPEEKQEDPTVIESRIKDKSLEKEYENKRVLCQAKIAECSLVSLANNLEMLVIGEDNHLKVPRR